VLLLHKAGILPMVRVHRLPGTSILGRDVIRYLGWC
jgi:hypothetical protein